uniref:Transposase Tc1-like domain-containing protein n=1 Tax=Ditylenchus dipsaci TaxID=166011 RepID=A0A915CRT3_9BILA
MKKLSSGSGADTNKWTFFAGMSFLDVHLQERPRQSHIVFERGEEFINITDEPISTLILKRFRSEDTPVVEKSHCSKKKRIKTDDDDFDSNLLAFLDKPTKEDNEEELFGKRVAKALERMDPRRRRQASIKIEQLLYEFEFGDGIYVDDSTVHRRLREAELFGRMAMKKTIVSPKNSKARLKFAKNYITAQKRNEAEFCGATNRSFSCSDRMESNISVASSKSGLKPYLKLWEIVDNKIRKRRFTNFDRMFDVIVEEWKAIPLETLMKLIRSMPRRCEQVVKQKGYPTRY